MLDALLDRTVVCSFDRTGYARHARRFEPAAERDLEDRDVLLTGGTAGIGRAAAEALVSRGARVHLWGRGVEAGRATVQALGARARFTSVDLGDLEAVGQAARDLPVTAPAAVVLNAGAMPWARQLTPQGHELVWASQVLGHLLLLRVLRARGALASDTRVVWVSSGGLYAQRLSLDDLRRDRGYQRHTVYANAKRAQLVLAQELAARWPTLHEAVMHPGWVRTEAVRGAMPIFYRLTLPILRTPAQGADTIVWLATTSTPRPAGRLWLDRAAQPDHLRAGTREAPEDRAALVETVFAATDPWVEGPDGPSQREAAS
ncbi:MAG: SDR family NAD(P)-dependent oxidoreductase [Alphaproteobacteria bacterium]|nr:SDR family NAD(P)-dependent oxidoreductase [Alphaproteobacteria bacterium]